MSQSAERPELTAVQRRGALLSVFLVVFIDLLGFGIVVPQLPLIGERVVGELFAGPSASALTGLVVGVLMASFSAMQFLFSPVWGRLSDRVGRRPVVLASLGTSVAFYILLAVGTTIGIDGRHLIGFFLLLLARVGAGVAGATIATAQAVIADVTTPDKRSRGMALIGVAFGIGFTFGPFIGALLVAEFPKSPAMIGYAAAVMSLCAFLTALVRMPETLRPREDAGRAHGHSLARLAAAMRIPNIGMLVIAFFFTTLAFTQFEVTLSFFNKTLGYVDKANYYIFAGLGGTLILATGLYRRMAGSISDAGLLRLGITGITLGQAGLAVVALTGTGKQDSSPTVTILYFASLFITAAGYAFINPSIQSIISRRTDPARQGEVLGVNQSAAALARVVGPAIGPPLFAIGARHSLPFALATLLLFGVLVLLSRLRDSESTIAT